MLQGPARAWLNSLQPNSINSWLDFKTAFVRNFTSTYVRPSPARLLALCVQDQDEPDHAYIKRWSELRNRCENVPEVLAIQNFVDGVKDGTMLKHRLLLEEPSTIAEMMAIVGDMNPRYPQEIQETHQDIKTTRPPSEATFQGKYRLGQSTTGWEPAGALPRKPTAQPEQARNACRAPFTAILSDVRTRLSGPGTGA